MTAGSLKMAAQSPRMLHDSHSVWDMGMFTLKQVQLILPEIALFLPNTSVSLQTESLFSTKSKS